MTMPIALPADSPQIAALWQALSGEDCSMIAVVASDPREGSATVGLALARAAAAATGSAMLVDLQLGAPGGIAAALLLPEGSPVEAGGGLVYFKPSITPGSTPPSARSILDIAERHAPSSFTVVVCAPVLSSEPQPIPGAAAATAAGRAILVLLSGKTPGSRVEEALRHLSRSGVTMAGCVLNDRDNPTLAGQASRALSPISRRMPRTVAGIRARLDGSRFLASQP